MWPLDKAPILWVLVTDEGPGEPNLRSLAALGDIFLGIGDIYKNTNTVRITVSLDRGLSWSEREVISNHNCGYATHLLGGMAAGNGLLIAISAYEKVCRFEDRLYWTTHEVGEPKNTNIIWDSRQFMAQNRCSRLTSPDGRDWTRTDASLIQLTRIAYSTEPKSYSGYNKNGRTFYYSADGSNW